MKHHLAIATAVACMFTATAHAGGFASLSVTGTIVPSCDPITGKAANGGEFLCAGALPGKTLMQPTADPGVQQLRVRLDAQPTDNDSEGLVEIRFEDDAPAMPRK